MKKIYDNSWYLFYCCLFVVVNFLFLILFLTHVYLNKRDNVCDLVKLKIIQIFWLVPNDWTQWLNWNSHLHWKTWIYTETSKNDLIWKLKAHIWNIFSIIWYEVFDLKSQIYTFERFPWGSLLKVIWSIIINPNTRRPSWIFQRQTHSQSYWCKLTVLVIKAEVWNFTTCRFSD